MPIDSLRVFMGDDYAVNDKIVIHQPTIREIVNYGEQDYFAMLTALTNYPSDMKSVLWDVGIDYTKITDFELFMSLCMAFPVERTRIIFGDLDFTQFRVKKHDVVGTYLEADDGTVIDWNVHRLIVEALTTTNLIHKEREIPVNESTKMALIEWDREDRALAAKRPYRSQLTPFLSAMVNYAGFKYDHHTVQDITIYQFFDAVQRVQLINNAQTLLQGMYINPFLDSSKVDKSHLNWMQDMTKQT